MRVIGKIVKWLLAFVVVLVVGAMGWLHFSPPALIRGAMAYSAKMVCSYHFLAGRDVQEVLANDVHAPAAHWLLTYVSADADTGSRSVPARLFGFLGSATAA